MEISINKIQQTGYPIVNSLLRIAEKKEIIPYEKYIEKVILQKFRGVFVGSSGVGKTFTLRKLPSQNTDVFDVDIDGIKADFENYEQVIDGRKQTTNIVQDVIFRLIDESSLSDRDQVKILGQVGRKQPIDKECAEKIKKDKKIPEFLKNNLLAAINNAQNKDDLSGVTLATESDKCFGTEWGVLYGERENYYTSNYSNLSHARGQEKNIFVGLTGSGCSLKPEIIRNSIAVSTWINLVLDTPESMERAIAQMQGKPIDRKGLSDGDLLAVRTQIYSLLSAVDIRYSDYKDIKSDKEMFALVGDRLKEKGKIHQVPAKLDVEDEQEEARA